MKEIYLDNSATTKVCDEAANKIYMMLTQKYGNPSSLHGKGFEAEREVEVAREIIANEIMLILMKFTLHLGELKLTT